MTDLAYLLLRIRLPKAKSLYLFNTLLLELAVPPIRAPFPGSIRFRQKNPNNSEEEKTSNKTSGTQWALLNSQHAYLLVKSLHRCLAKSPRNPSIWHGQLHFTASLPSASPAVFSLKKECKMLPQQPMPPASSLVLCHHRNGIEGGNTSSACLEMLGSLQLPGC